MSGNISTYSYCFRRSLVSKPRAGFPVEQSVENETGYGSDFESKTCLGSLIVLECILHQKIGAVSVFSVFFFLATNCLAYFFVFANFKNSHPVLMGRNLLILLCPKVCGRASHETGLYP